MPKRLSSLSTKKKLLKIKSVSKKSKKKPTLKTGFPKSKLIGLLFLFLSLFILLFPQKILEKSIDNNPIKINSVLYESKDTATNPIRIVIPQSKIDLKVVDANIINGFWEVSENTASYGLGSGHPGEKNNTIIFAHARIGLFYNLKDLKINDNIYIFTADKWFKYKINKITSVYPNQIEVIQPTKIETLTLYTCTGFYDEKRLVIAATPQD